MKMKNSGFLWGISSSSAQIEGAFNVDGRTPSVWDFRSDRGDIDNKETCHDAVGSYYKYKEDIRLIKELGCTVYRFSISWTRVCPNKDMKVNPKGLEYYEKVIDECIENGIKPIICLYHWDAPAWLFESDMWLSGEFLKYFPTYCEVVVSYFCNKVDTFMVLNEPACIAWDAGGNNLRKGNEYTNKEFLQIVHNVLLAHGLGAKVVKKYNCKLLTAINPTSYMPKFKTKNGIIASEKAFNACKVKNPGVSSMWLDPMVFGKYPEEYYKVMPKEDLPNITKEDMDIIKCDPDYIGLNLYFGNYVVPNNDSYKVLKQKGRKTQMIWPITPPCTYYATLFTYKRYNLPIYITENGCAFTMEDEKYRVRYIKNHIYYALKARRDGVDLRGYFYWSLIDNFEWYKGYTPKFGLVDKNRQKKNGFYTLKEIIKNSKISEI